MNAKIYGAYIVFLALPVKNGPLPTELKFMENTAFPHLFQENPAFCYFFICFLDSSFVSKNNEIKISN